MKKKFLSVLLALCMVAGTAAASPEQMIVQAAEEDIVDPVGDELRYGNYQYQVQQDGTVMITKYYDDGTTSIVIPSEIDGKKVTSMGESAFFECENLTNIVIPNSVKCIEKNAFSGCASLTSITIPDSVTTIGNLAFSRCYKLEDIQISDATYDIGFDAFVATAWLSAAFDNDDPYIILNHVLIEVKGDKSITNFTIPDSVTSIAGAAFRGFNNLTTVTIPDSVKYIGDYAFNQCTSLTNVTIPDSVIGIGEFAFYSCDNLTNITIPASVMQIGDAAFYGTTWLDNEAKKSPFVVINNILIDGSTASGNVNIPNTVTYIAGHAFYENKNITSVTIPASVTTVDVYAFSECPNLKNVVFLNPSTKFVYWRVFADSPNVSVSYGDQDQNTDNNSTENNNNNGQKTIALSAIKPSVTNVTYNGKAQQPTVVITDTTGQIVAPSNYTLTYSNNKNVGQAAVTATGIGNYTGTLTAVFNIVPKGTNLSKVTAKKKSFLAKWKKQSAQTSGYELQYATNAKFKGAKIKTVKKNKTTSIAVKKLKAKKKYYVRVRTYKTVKINGKSMKLYSNWSKAKKVKVK